MKARQYAVALVAGVWLLVVGVVGIVVDVYDRARGRGRYYRWPHGCQGGDDR